MMDIWNFLMTNWDKVMTIAFAGLSAVFAGLSFLVIWMEYRRNNPKVEVKLNRAVGLVGDDTVEFFVCTAVNKGRRPITLTSFNFYHKNKGTSLMIPGDHNHFFPLGYPQFPHDLEEGKKFEIMFYHSAVVGALSGQDSPVEAFRFVDTADNTYSQKIKKKYWAEFFKDKK